MEFLAIFREVPDPRVERTRVHPLINILTIALLSVICVGDGWEDLEEFGQIKEELRRVRVTQQVEWFADLPKWQGLRSLVTVERERTVAAFESQDGSRLLRSSTAGPASGLALMRPSTKAN